MGGVRLEGFGGVQGVRTCPHAAGLRVGRAAWGVGTEAVSGEPLTVPTHPRTFAQGI